MAIDLDAEIVPGVGGAGFNIGDSVDDVLGRISRSLDIQRVFTLRNIGNGAMFNSSQKDWKIHRGRTSAGPLSTTLTYGNEVDHPQAYNKYVVGLCFNSRGILYNIVMLAGYRGKHKRGMGVGSLLGEAFAWDDYEWDSSGEEYYPFAATQRGWSIIADGPFDEPKELFLTPILGFSVHDWGLQDRHRY